MRQYDIISIIQRRRRPERGLAIMDLNRLTKLWD